MKTLLYRVFSLIALFKLIQYRFLRSLIGKEKAFRGFTESLAKAGGITGVYLRSAAYGKVLAECHPTAQLGFGTVLSKPEARLEAHVYVGRYCSLGWVHLESDVMLADFVTIPSGGRTHSLAPGQAPREAGNSYHPVRIGRGTWVGSQAVVMADVGRYCTIGAGAVVTKPIPDHATAVGVPAKVVSIQQPQADPEAAPPAQAQGRTQDG